MQYFTAFMDQLEASGFFKQWGEENSDEVLLVGVGFGLVGFFFK